MQSILSFSLIRQSQADHPKMFYIQCAVHHEIPPYIIIYSCLISSLFCSVIIMNSLCLVTKINLTSGV